MSNRVQRIKSRKGFYRDNYNRVCAGLLIALSIIFILTALVLYRTIFSPASDFYASSQDGKLVHLTALNSPNYASTPMLR